MSTALGKEFSKRYGHEPEAIYFCPGRINLIGEHIDYNGGQVMPAAINRGTWLAIGRNTDKTLRFQCLNFPETAALHLQESYTKSGHEWFNFPLGVIDRFLSEGHDLSGMDLLIYGNLPVAAGLSSSASIEVLTAFALSDLFGIEISRVDIALLAKKVENEFIGVNCGIMDQFAVAMGKEKQAMLLNCDTLAHKYIPAAFPGYTLMIINTNKPRALADSKYNERFSECRLALQQLQSVFPSNHLCDISPAQFETVASFIPDETVRKRALHVVTENERVKLAAEALAAGRAEEFGALLYASHRSLKELYEVSGKELDTIVAFAGTFNGCIGARMTGAGFGGCAIALVKDDRVNDFKAGLTLDYTVRIGYAPEIFEAEISDGVKKVRP